MFNRGAALSYKARDIRVFNNVRCTSSLAAGSKMLDTIDLRRVFDTSVFSPKTDVVSEVANVVGSSARKNGFLFVTGTPVAALLPYLHVCNDWLLRQSDAALRSIQTDNTQRGYHIFQGSPFVQVDQNDSEVPSNYSDSQRSINDPIQAYTVQNPWVCEELQRDKYDAALLGNPDQLENSSPSPQLSESPLTKYRRLINTRVGLNINKPKGVFQPFQSSNQTFTRWPTAQFVPHTYTEPVLPIVDETQETDFSDYTELLPPFPLEMNHDQFIKVYSSYFAACTVTGERQTAQLLEYCGYTGSQIEEVKAWHDLDAHTQEMKAYPEASRIRLADQARTSLSTNDTVNTTPVADQQLRFPIHSDQSTLTLLTQTNGDGGLLQQDATHKWTSVPLHHSALLVNTGDFFRQFTNNFYPSTLHCVAAQDHSPQRTSTVFFYQPNMHALITDLTDQGTFEPFFAGDRYPYI